MRALVLTTSYPLAAGRLSGRFVEELLEGLQPLGWSFEVLTPAPREGGARTSRGGIRIESVPYPGHRTGLAHDGGMPDRIGAAPWLAACVPGMAIALERAAARRLAGARFDLIWSHWMLPAGWIGAGLARRSGIPHLVTAHGGDVHLAERIAALPGGRTLLRRRFAATRLSAPAVETAERVRRVLGGDRVEVAALPADVAPAEGPHRAPGAPLRALFLGRFEPIKGATLLLEAAAHPGAPALEIVLAGAGSEEASLRAMAAHARGPIRFAGVLDGAERNAALHAADVLVAPSRRTRGGRGEGLPHAATLALAAGVPVVTSDGGALARRVRMHDAGAVFDADGDRSAAAARLAAVLARTAADPEVLAAWRRGARAAGAAHRPEHALAAWKRVLTSASASPRGGTPRDVLAMETP